MNEELVKQGFGTLVQQINISYWVLQSIAMAVTCALIPKLKLSSIFGPLVMVVTLAFVNASIWDAALFFKLPNTFTTQALLIVGANGIIFWILVKLLPGIEVEGIMPALVAPLIFAGCSLAIGEINKHVDWPKVTTQALHYVQQAKESLSTPAQKGTTPRTP